MLYVGITGQSGFIGTHLFNYLKLKDKELILVPFVDSYFQDNSLLYSWVSKCDVIIHLAGMNRHKDETVIYNTNINLVRQMITALEITEKKPHLIFSSSLQENRDNSYGRSKKEGRELFISWAKKNNGKFTGLVMPNVFGPFGRPFYNSVVATFCYQLTHSENPKIDIDCDLKLIYVVELAEVIYKVLIERKYEDEYQVSHSYEKKVSDVLRLLLEFKKTYFDEGKVPTLNNRFEQNLFNTFLSFIDPGKITD
jgi:UDP-2-acetamido-2,6-beta-L-arabino-hexul-4-ose reductase